MEQYLQKLSEQYGRLADFIKGSPRYEDIDLGTVTFEQSISVKNCVSFLEQVQSQIEQLEGLKSSFTKNKDTVNFLVPNTFWSNLKLSKLLPSNFKKST